MKTILIAVSALNGIISRDSLSPVDWSSRSDKKHFREVTTEVGVMIMGRKTYETMKKPLPNRLNVVMTHHPEKYNDDNGLIFTSKTPVQILSMLEMKGYNKTTITGGPEIYTLFLRENLIDEIQLTIEPLFLQGKVSFLKELKRDISLELIDVEKLNNNTLLVKYRVLK